MGGSENSAAWHGILAIDTSTEQAGLALANGERVHVRSWAAGRTQTVSLLPAIDELCQDAGLTPAELSGVVVATGPGTFTGLRVGLSIAKGIVLARQIPLVGIPTLAIPLAEHDDPHVVAVLPAGRGRIVWQARTDGSLQPPVNGTPAELGDLLRDAPDALVVGELPEAMRDQIAAAHANVVWEERNPETLLRLGAERIAAGDVDDAVTLEPTYLHGVTVSAGPVTDRLKRKP